MEHRTDNAPEQHSPQTIGELYTQAATQNHLAHCTPCRTRHTESDAAAAANAASIARRDRRQLGLRAGSAVTR